jgi:hypothetical protein
MIQNSIKPVPLIDVTLVFMQKSLGNVFDSSTKQTREPSPDLLQPGMIEEIMVKGHKPAKIK